MPAVFEIVEGAEAGRLVEVARETVIGREGADVLVSDPLVSRRHARLTAVDGGGVQVEDLGSSNGTFVNGSPVTGVVRVTPADELVIGATVLQLQRPTAGGSAPSMVRAVPPALAVPERPPDYTAPVSGGPSGVPRLDAMLDARVRLRARLAPVAVFALVVLVVLVYLATR